LNNEARIKQPRLLWGSFTRVSDPRMYLEDEGGWKLGSFAKLGHQRPWQQVLNFKLFILYCTHRPPFYSSPRFKLWLEIYPYHTLLHYEARTSFPHSGPWLAVSTLSQFLSLTSSGRARCVIEAKDLEIRPFTARRLFRPSTGDVARPCPGMGSCF
jgi:hypothetical protein